ncbi:hypothetical protein SAMN05192539_105724 [Paraburkholderia diazotrophica]|uniref:Uncharacterized protein n=1 Tax=Paraburkholderia diazotrophica TaxID=667676 RepID=A0A1H7EGY1_9BURK|nr:hypothetical protein SAMN05192539_105724 [Paraburkholderia diazotrophica]
MEQPVLSGVLPPVKQKFRRLYRSHALISCDVFRTPYEHQEQTGHAPKCICVSHARAASSRCRYHASVIPPRSLPALRLQLPLGARLIRRMEHGHRFTRHPDCVRIMQHAHAKKRTALLSCLRLYPSIRNFLLDFGNAPEPYDARMRDRPLEIERERTNEVNCERLSSLSTRSAFGRTIGMPANTDRLTTEQSAFLSSCRPNTKGDLGAFVTRSRMLCRKDDMTTSDVYTTNAVG